MRAPLRELQKDRCFYCDERLNGRSDVDHFIPWARHPDNGLDNLVVAHAPCNNAKRDFLAAAEHVERWAQRTRSSEHALDTLARRYEWTRDAQRTLGVARAMYLRLPESTRLWRLEKDFVTVQKERIALALAA